MNKNSVADYYYMRFALQKAIGWEEEVVELQSSDGCRSVIDRHILSMYYIPVKNIRLAETCTMMISQDYKERFKAEYYQLKNRLIGLKSMVSLWDQGKVPFTPTCPREIYDIQIDAMNKYLDVLEKRASIENIVLDY